jgi:hypothetical protein
MPKIYEYLGIVLYFYSREHEPIHIHARKGDYETKAEFIIQDGKIVEINLRKVKGIKPLKGSDLSNFKDFLESYSDKIVQKWVDFFVLKKEVDFERISKKIK